MSPFQITARHRCCSNCAGVGKLTTSIRTIHQGRTYASITVRECTVCDGSGFKTGADRLITEGY